MTEKNFGLGLWHFNIRKYLKKFSNFDFHNGIRLLTNKSIESRKWKIASVKFAPGRRHGRLFVGLRTFIFYRC